jgi:macrolide-specific efflux system membrane fusion protein
MEIRRRAAPSILAVIPILAAGLALNACSFFLPREEKVPAPPLVSIPPVTYDTLAVAPGTIELTVTVPGTFVYADQAQLSFAPRGGWLKRVTVRIGDRVKAGDLIAELDTASLENSIAQQKLLVRKAQLAAERTRLLGGDKLQMEMAQIDTDLAGLQLEDLQTQLAQSRLTTPMAGVIVYLLATHGGVSVDAYRTFVQVADTTKLRLLYKGDRAVEFRTGMAVTVSMGESKLAGVVSMTPATAPPDAPDDLRNAVLITVPRLPASAGSGSLATITLVKARRDRVLTVPRDAVTSYQGRSFVQVLEDGIKKDRSVELGLQTDTLVEVVKGLAAGEQVVAR